MERPSNWWVPSQYQITKSYFHPSWICLGKARSWKDTLNGQFLASIQTFPSIIKHALVVIDAAEFSAYVCVRVCVCVCMCVCMCVWYTSTSGCEEHRVAKLRRAIITIAGIFAVKFTNVNNPLRKPVFDSLFIKLLTS